MDTNEIRAEVVKSLAGSRLLVIDTYRSSSNEVWDYKVRLLPDNGYSEIVQESLQLLLEDKVEKPLEIDLESWLAARDELIVSWRTTLAGGHARATSQSQLIADPLGFFVDPLRPELVILKHLQAVERQQLVGSVTSSRKSSSKTKAKEFIRSQVPLGTYVGQLNLGPLNVVRVQAC